MCKVKFTSWNRLHEIKRLYESIILLMDNTFVRDIIFEEAYVPERVCNSRHWQFILFSVIHLLLLRIQQHPRFCIPFLQNGPHRAPPDAAQCCTRPC